MIWVSEGRHRLQSEVIPVLPKWVIRLIVATVLTETIRLFFTILHR